MPGGNGWDSLKMASSEAVSMEESGKKRVFDIDDDEELSHGQHMIAGATAGVTEHAVMHPVDTVKTRMQVYSGSLQYRNPNFLTALSTIVQKEGILRLWRGVGAVLVSAGPAHAVHFATFEKLKQSLSSSAEPSPFVTGCSGAMATVVSEGLMVPMDVVKQRLQMSSETQTRSLWESIRHIYSNHGIGAFFAGYRTSLVMAIPFTAAQYSVYEWAKSQILKRRNISENQFSAGSHCLAGAIAGASASAITTPLDVVKTRLQTQGEVGARRYRDMSHALRTIYLEEGLRGLTRGIQPRTLFFTPAAAICWTIYEMSKHVLNVNSVPSPADDAVSTSNV